MTYLKGIALGLVTYFVVGLFLLVTPMPALPADLIAVAVGIAAAIYLTKKDTSTIK